MALSGYVMTNFMNIILLWALLLTPLSHRRCLVSPCCASAFPDVSVDSLPGTGSCTGLFPFLGPPPFLNQNTCFMSYQNSVYLWRVSSNKPIQGKLIDDSGSNVLMLIIVMMIATADIY